MKPIFSLLVSMLLASSAVAQGYPSKPISLIIPFGAGGDSDLSGRLLAQYAAKYLGNASFVPLNRVGASGSIGTMFVRGAAPDGYTLLVARIATHAIYPALESNAPYKWNEFTKVSPICAGALRGPIVTTRQRLAEVPTPAPSASLLQHTDCCRTRSLRQACNSDSRTGARPA